MAVGLVSEVGCKVGDQVTGCLWRWRRLGNKFMFLMDTPKRFIVRKLYHEGGAIVGRPSDPGRGWWRDAGMISIFTPERPPDIYVGAQFFKDFVVGGA